MKTEIVKLTQVSTNDSNPRTITDEKFERLIVSILSLPKMLELRPIVVDNMMTALGGNMRCRALTAISQMTEEEVLSRLSQIETVNRKPEGERDALYNYWRKWLKEPTAIITQADTLTEEEQNQFIIADNVGYGEWDMDALANSDKWDTSDLLEWGLDVWDADGSDDDSESVTRDSSTDNDGILEKKFVIPPFSILDTRSGRWQKRKKQWRAKVSNTDIGDSRQGTLIQSLELQYKDLYQASYKHRKELGVSFKEYLEKYCTPEELEKERQKVTAQGTSLFDPVLAEVVMRWFCPPQGRIIDPFGGEQTKGLVAGELGYQYNAVEIRPDQVEANNKATEEYPNVKYFCGDSNNISDIITETGYDLCFTSPPYYDLEVYSKEDMSALGTYEEFMSQYENIFRQCVEKMADDGSFLVVKISEIRNKKTGEYRNFVGDNITIFKRLGLQYYNEIILVEPSTSVALRAQKTMESRKVARTHQNVLVFFKGDMKRIKDKFPAIEYTEEDAALFSQEFSTKDDGDTED